MREMELRELSLKARRRDRCGAEIEESERKIEGRLFKDQRRERAL